MHTYIWVNWIFRLINSNNSETTLAQAFNPGEHMSWRVSPWGTHAICCNRGVPDTSGVKWEITPCFMLSYLSPTHPTWNQRHGDLPLSVTYYPAWPQYLPSCRAIPRKYVSWKYTWIVAVLQGSALLGGALMFLLTWNIDVMWNGRLMLARWPWKNIILFATRLKDPKEYSKYFFFYRIYIFNYEYKL